MSGVILLLFVGGIGALPMLLQAPPVLQRCLKQLNQIVPGAIQVQSCTVGWLSGLECRKLALDLPAQGIQLQAETFKSDKGVLAYAFAPQYLGELTIDRPTVVFTQQASQAVAPGASPSQNAEGGEAQTGQPDRVRQQPVRWWERTAFRLRIFDGSAVLQREAAPPLELAKTLSLAGSLAEGTITYALSFQSGAASGQVQAEGFLNLPSDRLHFFDALVSKTELTIKDTDITPFLELGAVRAHLPSGSGMLEANVHVDTAGLAEMKVLGDVHLAGLKLTGGFLGQDTPEFDAIRLAFNSNRKRQEGWRLTTLKLESAPLQFDAQGQVDAQTVSLQAKGAVNLPVLAKQIPRTLALDEQTELQEGSLDFSLGLTGTPQQVRVKAGCLTNALKISNNGQPFHWQSPLNIALEGGYEQGQVQVGRLEIATPFLQMTGADSGEGFTVQATADLEQMSRELHKLFAGGFAGKGKLTANGFWKTGADSDTHQLEARCAIAGLEMLRDGKTVVPAHEFHLQGHAEATGASLREWQLRQLALDTSFWPGQLTFATGKDQPAHQSSPRAVHASANLDLEKMTALGRALGVSVPEGQWQGALVLSGDGEITQDQVTLQSLTGAVAGLSWQTGGDPLKQPAVTLALDSSVAIGNSEAMAVRELVVAKDWQEFSHQDAPFLHVDWKKRSVDWRHLLVKSEDLALQTSARWHDWRQLRQNFQFAGETKAQASLLAKLLNKAGLLPKGLDAQGSVQAELAMNAPGEGPVLGNLSVQSGDMIFLQGNKKLNTGGKLQFKTSFASPSAQNEEASISSCSLRTPLFRAEGSGKLQWTESRPVLLLQGQCLPNYEILSARLTASAKLPLTLAGTKAGPFQLTLPLGAAQETQGLRWTMTLPVESLRWKNVEVKGVELPLEYNKDTLHAKLAASFSGGKLALQPRWHFGATNAGLVLPANSQVLTAVAPSQTLTSEVLAYLHPLLGVLATPAGVLDLQLKQVAFPAQAGNASSPVFTAVVELADPALQTKGILKELLEMSGLEGKSLRLQQRTLTCKGSDGRIVCDPVTILSGEKAIRLKAVTGFDGSLDYSLQWPLTGHLLGEDKGATVPATPVKVSITGTVAAPKYNRQEFQANVRELASQLRPATPPVAPAPAPPAPSGGT